MKWRSGRWWVSLGVVGGAILISALSLAQVAVPTGKSAGTAGTSCSGLGEQYAWPDANGQVLSCVSNIWTLVGQTAAAAGSTTQLQYNNAGALGGTTGLTWDSTNQALTLATIANPAASALTITGGGITGTTSYPALNITQTWNNAGGAFTGILENVTNTASNVNSLLMDLQVGGATKFNVQSNGNTNLTGNLQVGTTGNIKWQGRTLMQSPSDGILELSNNGQTSFTSLELYTDTYLTRAAAASLHLGNIDSVAPVAQTLGVQNVVTGTTNTAGADFTINGSQGTGTGAGGRILFQVAPAGSTGSTQNALTTAMTIGTTGNVGIGTTSSTVALDVYTGTVRASAVTAPFALNLTSNSSYAINIDAYYGGLNLSPSGGGTNVGSQYNMWISNNPSLSFWGKNSATTNNTTVSMSNDSSGHFSITRSSSTDVSGTYVQMPLFVSGNVGIGTTVPQSKLSVNGGVAIGSAYAGVSAAPTDSLIVSGSVGIGTTSSTVPLTIVGTGTTGGAFASAYQVAIGQTSDAGGIAFARGSDGAQRSYIGPDGSTSNGMLLQNVSGGGRIVLSQINSLGYLSFQVGAALDAPLLETRMTSTGVGIGTTAPAYLLQVGSASATGIVMELQTSSGTCTLSPSTSSMTTTCSSDVRLKTDIRDTEDVLPWLADMRVRDFTIKATGENSTGVIAQEVLLNHPDMVRLTPDGFYAVDTPNQWKMIKAIQELKALNDGLAAQVLDLKAANIDETEEIKDEAAEIKELRDRLETLESARH